MKNLLTVFLIISLLTGTYSCQEGKSHIEIIKNYDNIYLSKEKVDKPAYPDNDNKKLISELINILKELHGNKNKKMLYPISYKVYIGKDGNIEKLMDNNLYMIGYLVGSKIEKSKDLTINNIYQNTDRLTKKLLPFFEKFKYKPAKLGGKSVPFRTQIKSWGIVDKNGKATFEISFLKGKSADFNDNISSTNDTYFLQVEEMPSIIGGVKGIQEKIHYPEIAKRAGIEGRVYVKAYIDEKGNVTEAEIIKGLGGGCDEEALKAVKEAKFIPGRQKGKPVKTQVSIPISFKLDSKNFNSDSKIVGKWEGKTNSGEIIKIKFFSDGTTNLYKSKSGRMKDKITPAIFWPKFKIDYSTTPNTLDLIYNSKSISKCLVKFVSNDEIIIALPKKLDKRPKSFNKNDVRETWNLKRIQ